MDLPCYLLVGGRDHTKERQVANLMGHLLNREVLTCDAIEPNDEHQQLLFLLRCIEEGIGFIGVEGQDWTIVLHALVKGTHAWKLKNKSSFHFYSTSRI